MYYQKKLIYKRYLCFASFLSGGFTTMAVMNPLEKKLEKRTPMQWSKFYLNARSVTLILKYIYSALI